MRQRCLVVGLINTLDHVGKITSNVSSRPTTVASESSIPSRITNMASSDSDDDILASIIAYF